MASKHKLGKPKTKKQVKKKKVRGGSAHKRR